MVRNKEIAQRFLLIFLSGIPLQKAYATEECKAPCVPFNVTNVAVGGFAALQPEYTNCTTKKKTISRITQGTQDKTELYCVDPKGEVRVEEWAGSGSNSWHVWGPTPVANGWNVKCREVNGTVSCNATSLKPQNCQSFTVKNHIYSELQPEYTECVSKNYIKAQLARGHEETYSVEAGTEVRVEVPRGYSSSVNLWAPRKVENGWVVDCKESAFTVEKCTETPIK